MLDLVINLDEIGCDIIKSIFEMKNFGINQCEIRLVGNRNIAQLSEKECINLKKILDSFHLEAYIIDSPIFKWKLFKQDIKIDYKKLDLFGIKPDLDEREKIFLTNNVLRNAKLLGAKNIRIFSGIDCKVKEFLGSRQFNKLIKENLEFNFLVENETSCAVKSLMDLTKVAEYIEVNSFKNVGILFDVGNAALVERGFKITDMSKIKNFVQHVHLKNFIHENDVVKFVNLEEGELNYKQIFEFLEENFRDREVKLGVETDVWSPQCRKKTFFKSVDFFKKCVEG